MKNLYVAVTLPFVENGLTEDRRTHLDEDTACRLDGVNTVYVSMSECFPPYLLIQPESPKITNLSKFSQKTWTSCL